MSNNRTGEKNRLYEKQKWSVKSKKEAQLTLTPSGFLFSRLLAAVEKKVTHRNQWPAGISVSASAHTHYHIMYNAYFRLANY